MKFLPLAACCATAAASLPYGRVHHSHAPARAVEEGRRNAQGAAKDIASFAAAVAECYDVNGLTLSVVADGELLEQSAYGFADRDAGQAADVDTIFSIGSTSKAFTATLVGMLVDDGLLDWDTPVREYWDEFGMNDPWGNSLATLRDLLAHKTSVPRNDASWYLGAKSSPSLALERFKTYPLDKGFRASPVIYYNNWAVAIAGYVAAHVAGMPYSELLQTRLLDPLGMESTTLDLDAAIATGDYAVPVAIQPDGTYTQLPATINSVLNSVAPAGAIHSTSADMAKWLQFQLDNGAVNGTQLISTASLDETRAPQFTLGNAWLLSESNGYPEADVYASYGFGWIQGSYAGRRQVAHNGGTIGHATLVVQLPDDNVGVFMSQTGNTNIADSVNDFIAWYAMDVALGQDPWITVDQACSWLDGGAAAGPQAPPLAAGERSQRASRELADYAGQYVLDGYGLLEFELQADGSLVGSYANLTGTVGLSDQRDYLNTNTTGLYAPIFPDEIVYGYGFTADDEDRITGVTARFYDEIAMPHFVRLS